MSADQYVLWFITMAVLILLILGTGTLVMAGIIRRPHLRREESEVPVSRHLKAHDGGHHHWYDRFHHAA
ncbi:hypothetical protein [Nocardioides stalactiti]|uniref:hypothetical protein n=1 Tax=Nocardioides stalactiti TaxID=2755356 RepID=UPI001600F868|nr:hypothetical protein [Nocardioides stalactiti]